MSIIVKGSLGAIGLLVPAYLLYWFVLYDLAVVSWHPATRANTAGKRVLITGSSRGIGEALALVYAELGAHVTLHSRYSSSLQQVAAECRRRGSPGVHSVVGDMSVPGDAARVVNAAADAMGGLDIVVVNHADSKPFDYLSRSFSGVSKSSDELQPSLRTNLLSYIEASMTALPHLENTNGSLVLVSSIITRLPLPYCFDYCFAKRAIEGFLSSLRQELAMNGSHVHAGLVVPGSVDTKLARTVMAKAPEFQSKAHYTSPWIIARDIAALPVARNREIVSPWTMRLPTIIGSWAPELLEEKLRWVIR